MTNPCPLRRTAHASLIMPFICVFTVVFFLKKKREREEEERDKKLMTVELVLIKECDELMNSDICRQLASITVPFESYISCI